MEGTLLFFFSIYLVAIVRFHCNLYNCVKIHKKSHYSFEFGLPNFTKIKHDHSTRKYSSCNLPCLLSKQFSRSLIHVAVLYFYNDRRGRMSAGAYQERGAFAENQSSSTASAESAGSVSSTNMAQPKVNKDKVDHLMTSPVELVYGHSCARVIWMRSVQCHCVSEKYSDLCFSYAAGDIVAMRSAAVQLNIFKHFIMVKNVDFIILRFKHWPHSPSKHASQEIQVKQLLTRPILQNMCFTLV